MSYSYNPNGEKVHAYILELDAISFGVLMANFAHSIFSNDSCAYTIEKWWKFCDDVAEWLIYDDEEFANSLNIYTPTECADCGGKGWSLNPIEHEYYCGS